MESKRATLCQSYIEIAKDNKIVVTACEVEVCDECSAAHTSTISAILALVVATYMVM